MRMKEAALKGPTEEIKKVAEIEGIDPVKLARYVAKGYTVILRNIVHNVSPVAVGRGVKVKINANIGTSRDYINVDEEIEKAKVAKKYGADTIMDLSTGGDLDEIRRKIMKEVPMVIGTVPIYQAAEESLKKGKAIVEMTEDDMFNVLEKHFKDGVDFVTVHAGVTKAVVEKFKDSRRVVGVVSRGGAFLAAWIIHHGEENPYYKNYDYLLEMAAEYDVTLSLGDGLRPGGLPDATDFLQISELYTIGRLVKRAREKYVQAMVEGPGHIPIDQIEANVRMAKIASDNAPFYVLGPLVTDIAPGYDHIVAAIGGAIAAMAGADFLCYVTPSEHLALPTAEDVKEGVIATKIAAHAVNLTRFKDEFNWDYEMSKARGTLNWKKQIELAMDKEKALKVRTRRAPITDEHTCSMCGDLCAIEMVRKYLKIGRD